MYCTKELDWTHANKKTECARQQLKLITLPYHEEIASTRKSEMKSFQTIFLSISSGKFVQISFIIRFWTDFWTSFRNEINLKDELKTQPDSIVSALFILTLKSRNQVIGTCFAPSANQTQPGMRDRIHKYILEDRQKPIPYSLFLCM